tara:strand:+ start:10891 stop:11406 length:516 start_codon:yes stop_codon:yes gene_type:complete
MEEKEFKGVREGNLRRKANKILANAESEGRAVNAQEQDRLKDLKSKAMSAEARNQKKKQRYSEYKERVDDKRERYADKMEGKGILTREQAMGRFDNLRGIKARSAEILQNTLKQDGEAPADENGDRKTGFALDQDHIAQGMSDVPEDPVYNESNPASRFMLDTGESGFGNV